MKNFLLFISIFVISISGFSQNEYNIQFQDETLQVTENIQSFEWSQLPQSTHISNGYMVWVQFYNTPTQNIQDAFAVRNIELIEYIPHRTYAAFIPENISVNYLSNQGVRAIMPIEGRFKMSQDLKNDNIGDWARQGDKIKVTLQFHKNVDVNYVVGDLANHQIALSQMYKGSNNLDLVIPDNCLQELSNLPYVKWVEVIVAPDVKDDTRGRGLHRANALDTQGAGRNYTGAGVGVMVRDDGIVGPHIDFQGRIDNSLASGTGQSHGDGVGGIMAGSGNLDPTKRGMAAGSDVYVVNYNSSFLDGPTQSLINSNAVQITNSSYSNGCNAGYTSATQTVDQQTLDLPNLLHVFSAGNSNNNNCGYGAGSQWGNITGGHKQGKNVIATANVLFNGTLVGSSSRGPAHDGRIKPDIAAHGNGQASTNENNTYQGFSGTSAAAPGIAGVSAQLYEAYKNIHGDFPPSGLIKAALMNTANDYGNVGPDFKFGWGIVNALRAGILIEDERHLIDEVSQGNTNTHNITVPSGTTQVRFMIHWSDVPASPGASPALVNDLDLVVTDPSNGSHLPWILDSTPDPTLLDLPATNGEDHLNNVEQVLINNPAPGTYELEVTGFNVPMGPQSYYIVYEIIEENLTLTYPNAGETFVTGESETIHWDAINTTEGFTLEYSTDNGGSWITINTVGNNVTNFNWTPPSTLTGEAKIRITSGAYQDESDGTFSIAPLVSGLTLTQVCPGQASFEWNSYTGADSFDLYILGEKFMEVAGNSASNNITVPITNTTDPFWYAIVAKNTADGWKSRRTIANQYSGGLLNCTLVADIGVLAINNSPSDFSTACGVGNNVISINLKNFGANAQSNFDVMYEVTGQAPVIETYTGTLNPNEEVTYEFTTPLEITENGGYTLVVSSDLNGDENPFNDTKEMSFGAYVNAVVLLSPETFEDSGVPPAHWALENPDTDLTWEEKTGITGVDGNSTKAAYMNNYDYNGIDQNDALVTDLYDLSELANNGTLKFDLAKAQYSGTFSDILFVSISTDCGETFTIIYGKTGLELSTLPSYNTTPNWEPTAADQWRTEEIDLSAYVGEQVIFKFINVSKNGNSTFIDNVFIDGLLSTETFELDQIVMAPNPAQEQVAINFGGMDTSNARISIYNNLGQLINTYGPSVFVESSKAVIDVSNLSQQIYFVKIEVGNAITTKKLLVK